MYIRAAHVKDTGMPLRNAISVTILAFDINRAVDVERRRIMHHSKPFGWSEVQESDPSDWVTQLFVSVLWNFHSGTRFALSWVIFDPFS